MTGLIFALVVTLLVGLGARDQVLVARLSARQGQRPLLLIVALLSSIAAAAAAAWAGSTVAGMIDGNARLILVGLALAMAGTELLILAPRSAPIEPTNSLGAFAIVIFATQLTDAARFAVFALAALTRAPIPTGIGGAIGAMMVAASGWYAAHRLAKLDLVPPRRWLGAGMIVLAVVLGLRGTGFI